MEIERKFLVQKLPQNWRSCPQTKIVQGYFRIRNRSLQIRLRHKGRNYLLGIKQGEGLSRQEIEITLSVSEFRKLWPLTGGRRLSKIRYELPWQNAVIEMDVFSRPYRGLILAEVEFRSEKASRSFRPPGWFGREVTGSQKYSNERLAARIRKGK